MTKKTIIRHFVQALLVGAIIFFLLEYLLSNIAQVKAYQFSFNYLRLTFSTVLFLLSSVGFSFAWRFALRSITREQRLTPLEALRIYVLADFGKYLPGKVWTIAGKLHLGRQLGIDEKHLLVSSLVEQVMGIIGVLLVGAVFLVFSFSNYNYNFVYAAFGLILIGFIGLQPKIFYPVINWMLHKVGRETIPPEMHLTWSAMLRIITFYLCVDILYAASFYVFVSSFTIIKPGDFFVVTAAFLLGAGLGVAALFAPSGLGVREGILSGILQLVMPLPVAILTSLLARLWTVSGEVILFLLVFLGGRSYRLLESRSGQPIFTSQSSVTTNTNAGWGSKEWMELRFASIEVFGGDKWGHGLRRSQQYRTDQTLFLLKPHVINMRGKNVLDVGCALCDFTNKVVALNPKNHYYATDISSSAIDYDRDHFKNIQFKCEALPELSYPDSLFDVISALEVLCYLNERGRKEATANIYRCLKPGGILLFSTVIDNGERYFNQKQIDELFESKFTLLEQKTLYLKQFHMFETFFVALNALNRIYKTKKFSEIEAYVQNPTLCSFLSHKLVYYFLRIPVGTGVMITDLLVNNRFVIWSVDHFAAKFIGVKAMSIKIHLYQKRS